MFPNMLQSTLLMLLASPLHTLDEPDMHVPSNQLDACEASAA